MRSPPATVRRPSRSSRPWEGRDDLIPQALDFHPPGHRESPRTAHCGSTTSAVRELVGRVGPGGHDSMAPRNRIGERRGQEGARHRRVSGRRRPRCVGARRPGGPPAEARLPRPQGGGGRPRTLLVEGGARGAGRWRPAGSGRRCPSTSVGHAVARPVSRIPIADGRGLERPVPGTRSGPSGTTTIPTHHGFAVLPEISGPVGPRGLRGHGCSACSQVTCRRAVAAPWIPAERLPTKVEVFPVNGATSVGTKGRTPADFGEIRTVNRSRPSNARGFCVPADWRQQNGRLDARRHPGLDHGRPPRASP
jgi:hypothetical protein